MVRFLASLTLCAALAGCTGTSKAKSRPVALAADAVDATVDDQLLSLHNQARANHRLPPFVIDESLNAYAQDWAAAMAARGGLQHSSLRFLGANGIRTAAENIAWNQRSPEEVVNCWLNSPGHRRNMLNPTLTRIGFGLVKDSDGHPYWCVDFGG